MCWNKKNQHQTNRLTVWCNHVVHASWMCTSSGIAWYWISQKLMLTDRSTAFKSVVNYYSTHCRLLYHYKPCDFYYFVSDSCFIASEERKQNDTAKRRKPWNRPHLLTYSLNAGRQSGAGNFLSTIHEYLGEVTKKCCQNNSRLSPKDTYRSLVSEIRLLKCDEINKYLVGRSCIGYVIRI